jgi:hypothetical protein
VSGIAQAVAATRDHPRDRDKRRAPASDEAKGKARATLRLRRDAYAALLTDDGWRAFLRARCLHTYSWRNCALIAYQAPDACAVATYNAWKGHGLQVEKGSTCRIFITRKKPTGGFGSVGLFDVAQTNSDYDAGEILPDDLDALVASLYAAVSRPETPEQVKDRGDAIQAAYDALTSAQA